jgi:serine protease Do
MPTKGDRIRAITSALFLLLIGVVAGMMLVSEFRMMPVGQAVDESKKPAPTVPNVLVPGDQSFVKIAKEVTPAVVNISTTRTIRENPSQEFPFNDPMLRRFFGDDLFQRRHAPQNRKEQSLGSGVIVSADGIIVTNDHVVSEADDIQVLLEDGREFKGKLIGKDKKSDIAVIRIDATDLPTIPWGNSDQMEVGEYVVAVGNPFGLNQTVTMGIVSAMGRANVGITDYEDFIQTDAAINPGNSGGAMVNIQGELVGINTAIFTRSGGYMGIGFAVPSNMVRSVVDSLVKTGKVVRGWLGVSIQDVSHALAKEFGLNEAKGALVTDVFPDSPAKDGKLKRGDVIIAFMDQPIDNTAHLRNIVARTAVGTKASVKIVRDKKEEEVIVTISAQPKEIAEVGEKPAAEFGNRFGIEVQELTPDLAEQFDLRRNEKGVVVTQVAPSSPADSAGLREGDLIVEVNRYRILTLRSYEEALSNLKEGRSILFLISRQGNQFFLTITPEIE